jgi:2-keto-4-pentenoate hydratase/2-oxohepta-3-ene-1,7-dioic acid hydratase in catechol pathway
MKIICIGGNYKLHVQEMGSAMPSEPVFFLKPDSAILRNNQDFFIPDFSEEIHYELELVIKIDKIGKSISKKFAPRYYSSIGLGIDFTARDIQHKAMKNGLPWTKAKGFDKSAPISKFIPLKKDINDINFRLEKNNEVVQKANSSEMIFSVDELICNISKYMTLKIGDLIFTGTPSGVGKVEIGDSMKGYLEEELLLDFNIK